MAQIPRYFSESAATPAINTVKMDPRVAAAPYEAAADTAGHLTNLFKGELDAWGKVIAAKDQEQQRQLEKQQKIKDGLYRAETMANLRIGAEQSYVQGLEESQGDPNFPNVYDQHFQKMADQAILNAPSEDAKIALTKQLIGMRAQYNIRASKDSTRLSNQINMDKLEGVLDNFLGMASANPSSIDAIKGESLEVAKSMRALGLPERSVLKVFEKFDDKLERTAVRSRIQQDPHGVKADLEAGKFAHLGGGASEEFQNLIKATESAYQNKIGKQLEDMEKRLLAGQPITNNVEEVKALANKFGLSDRAEELTRLLDVDKFAADADATSLRTAARELTAAATSGALQADPAQVKKLSSFLEGNLKAMEQDPLGYAELRGAFDALPVITDFTKVTPQEIEERQFRALQAANKYQVPALALRQVDVENAVQQIKAADPAQKGKLLENISKFGQKEAERVSEALKNEDPTASVALRLAGINPSLAPKLMQGQAILKAGQAPKTTRDEMMVATENALENIYVGDPVKRQQIAQAAESLRALEHSKGNQLSLEDAIKGMLNIKEVGNWSFRTNYKLVMPKADLTENEFLTTVDSTLSDPSAWKKFASGVPIATDTGEPLRFNNIKPSDFQYIFDGDGQYFVTYEGNPVVDATGKQTKIDLASLFK